MQIDTAGRLLDWYGTDLRNAVMMARASSGLDVDGSEDLAGLARQWTSTRRAQLRSLPVFIISPEMADVCIAAALTLNTSDTTDACSADFPAGHLLLPADLQIRQPMASVDVEDVRAISWFPCQIADVTRMGERGYTSPQRSADAVHDEDRDLGSEPGRVDAAESRRQGCRRRRRWVLGCRP